MANFIFCSWRPRFAMHYVFRFASPSVHQHFVKQLTCTSRNISILSFVLPPSVLLDKSNHQVIYEFPFISHATRVIRTKYWVPAFASLLMPFGMCYEELRFTLLGIFVSSWLHTLFVHAVSKLTVNVVGKVYVNKENEDKDVIISSIDSKGNRIDRLHKRNDLIMCNYSSKRAFMIGFVSVLAQESNIMYKLNVTSCKIHDKEKYISLFGSNVSS